MPSPSAFQRLPLHIAESIALNYVYRIHNLTNKHTIYIEKSRRKWLELCKVSYSWKVLSLGYLCCKVELDISTTMAANTFTFTHSPPIADQRPESYCYVREISIRLHDINKPITGQMYRRFSVVWPKVVVFPCANLLSITIEGEIEQPAIEGVAIQSELFNWVAHRIRSSMPNLERATIKHAFGNYKRDTRLKITKEQPPNSLFLALFEMAKRVDIYASPVCLVSNDIYLQNGAGLARLSYNCVCNMDFLHFILQRSASTLVDLGLTRYRVNHIRRLLFDDNNMPIVYPRLRYLHVEEGMKSTILNFSVDKSIVPFPVLRQLGWIARYVFKDDTLFRGESRSWSSLYIGIDSELVDALKDENPFTNGICQSIKHVGIMQANSLFSRMVKLTAFTEFIASLVSLSTRSFTSDIKFSYQDIANIFSSPLSSESIRRVILYKTSLTLREMVDLVGIFPRIKLLWCMFEGIDSEFDGHQARAIVDQLRARQGTQCQPIQHICIGNAKDVPAISLATIVVVFAAVFQDFFRINALNVCSESIRREIAAITESGSFDELLGKVDSISIITGYDSD